MTELIFGCIVGFILLWIVVGIVSAVLLNNIFLINFYKQYKVHYYDKFPEEVEEDKGFLWTSAIMGFVTAVLILKDIRKFNENNDGILSVPFKEWRLIYNKKSIEKRYRDFIPKNKY